MRLTATRLTPRGVRAGWACGGSARRGFAGAPLCTRGVWVRVENPTECAGTAPWAACGGVALINSNYNQARCCDGARQRATAAAPAAVSATRPGHG